MDRPPTVMGRLASVLGATFRVALGGLALLASPYVPALLGLPPALGVVTFGLAFVLVWAFASTGTYPVTAVGPRRRVVTDRVSSRSTATNHSGHDSETEQRCDACGVPADGGVRRRYAEEFALLGSPLYTMEWGGNVYCERCAEVVKEMSETTATVPVERPGEGDPRGMAVEPETEPIAPSSVAREESELKE